jgi:hypothetical protein
VVPTKEEEVFFEFDLVGQQQHDCLNRLLASIHVIAKEQVVGLWREATIFEKSEQIGELTMHIALQTQNVSNLSLDSLPQILIGASNSKNTGYSIKTSRAALQSIETSFSFKAAFLPVPLLIS